ncbi:MAG TPA: tRNA (adenosine(37)-N6)-dimethylallyltransferase MiaA [Leptospiraceae bacterium]|nr:tRNA (adenosine(37)-N6)-dimethylallyltransferase MiaA [Leptospiraceae bacterium]
MLAAPTGGGKTGICVRLNPDFFEVVSVDSRQAYQFLNIGTAKPEKSEQAAVPHHLIDFIHPKDDINARMYSENIRSCVLDILKRNKTPILTCGTGFYLRAFLKGMYPVPEIKREITEKIENLSSAEKWAPLNELDPEAGKSLNEQDIYRVERALAINLAGKKWSELRPEGGFTAEFPEIQTVSVWVEWDRKELYERINERSAEMIRKGMPEEAEEAAEKFGEDCPALKTLGYNFALDYIRGKISLDSLKDNLAQSHRNYAKKQITWFRAEEMVYRLNWQDALNLLQNTKRDG